MKIDLGFDSTRLEEILAFIRDFSGVNILLDANVRSDIDPDRPMNFKVKDMVLKDVLRLLGSVLGLRYVVTEEHVVLLTGHPAR